MKLKFGEASRRNWQDRQKEFGKKLIHHKVPSEDCAHLQWHAK